MLIPQNHLLSLWKQIELSHAKEKNIYIDKLNSYLFVKLIYVYK